MVILNAALNLHMVSVGFVFGVAVQFAYNTNCPLLTLSG